jgi:DNA-binding transcriptional ArsR family regulator
MTQEKSSVDDSTDNDDKNNLLYSLKEFIKILDSQTRLNLLQALFVYRSLNLTQLSQILEVSKSTVLHHLKKFEELDLVTNTKVKAKFGSLPTKIYQFNVEIFDTITRKFDYFINFHNCENREDYLTILRGKQLFFTMIGQIFEKTVQYLTNYEQKIKESDAQTQDELFSLMNKNNIWFNIDYLTKNRREFVMEETKNGNIPIRTPDHVESPEEAVETHPFLAFHVLLPIPPILNFNQKENGEKNN